MSSVLARLATATAVGSLGLAAGGTGGALLISAMSGSTAGAGLPVGFVVAGSALGALCIGRLTPRIGRAAALACGYAAGVLGAIVVLVAADLGSVPLLLAGHVLLGPANAAVFLSRYAGAAVSEDGRRGAAMGVMLFAAALGAIAGPMLLEPSAQVAYSWGLDRAAGLYLVTLGAFWVAATLLATARGSSSERRQADAHGGLRLTGRGWHPARALVVLAAANAVMVAIMAVAPVHLVHAGHDLSFLGLAIGVHVAGMLAVAPMTGWLADRLGPSRVAASGGLLLGLAAVASASLDLAAGTAPISVLLVLGLGWNGAVVGGSALLSLALTAAERPRAEALGEVTMGVAAAVGAALAGLIVAGGGFSTLSLAGCLAALAVVVAARPGAGARRRVRVFELTAP
jgi:MFS family permease